MEHHERSASVRPYIATVWVSSCTRQVKTHLYVHACPRGPNEQGPSCTVHMPVLLFLSDQRPWRWQHTHVTLDTAQAGLLRVRLRRQPPPPTGIVPCHPPVGHTAAGVLSRLTPEGSPLQPLLPPTPLSPTPALLRIAPALYLPPPQLNFLSLCTLFPPFTPPPSPLPTSALVCAPWTISHSPSAGRRHLPTAVRAD